MKIPGNPTTNISTPSAEGCVKFFGGKSYEGVTISRDEHKHLRRTYEFSDKVTADELEKHGAQTEASNRVLAEKLRNRKSWENAPDPIRPFDAKGVREFVAAGEDQNLFRLASRDGMRAIAFLSRFTEPGQDPVKLLVQLAADAGWDVSGEDVEWAEGLSEDSSSEEEEEE